jgi:alcohol dehydrogenase class IV
MAWGDTLAGLCIANAGVTLPHGIGMAMGGLYPYVAHGEALACVYPAVIRYSWEAAPAKFAAAGRIFDGSLAGIDDAAAAEKLGAVIEAFLKRIGLRIGLDDLKIPEAELKTLAQQSLVLPDYKNHPRVADQDEIHDILLKSYKSGS